MWTLLVRVPHQEPQDLVIIPGRNAIGRKSTTKLLLPTL